MSAARPFDYWCEPVTETGCWLWTGGTNSELGYGAVRFRGRKQFAHRVSWMLHRGEIPDGLHVCHRCDVPACVNPAHLFLGTVRDNMQDASRKGRLNGKLKRPHTKLDSIAAEKIRADHRLQREIAADYGVSRHLIGMIKRGQRWPHVTTSL